MPFGLSFTTKAFSNPLRPFTHKQARKLQATLVRNYDLGKPSFKK